MKIDLSKFLVTRPEKICWWFPEVKDGKILPLIKSKKLRKSLSQYEQIISDNKINFEIIEMNASNIDRWLDFYSKIMTDLNYEVLATKDKLMNFSKSNDQLFMMNFFMRGRMVGTKAVTTKNDTVTGRYKASIRIGDIARGCSFGSLMDYAYVKYFTQQNTATKISFGKSRNMFGVTNNLSYLSYKLSFGQIPKLVEDVENLNWTETDENGFVIFVGNDINSNLCFYSTKVDNPPDIYQQIKNRLNGEIVEL